MQHRLARQGAIEPSRSVASWPTRSTTSDASGDIISLLGFRLASKPADAEHPTATDARVSLGPCVAVLILIIGVELVRSSSRRYSPEPVEFNIAIVAVPALSSW
ncbi:MAG: hypothetical protein ACLTQI_07180 [Slackia sp.]